MPVLHRYVDGSGCYVRSSLKGTIVTHQLTEAGDRRLKAAGVRPDAEPFPLRLLADLVRSGDAVTGGTGLGDPLGGVSTEQLEFGFPEDKATEESFPCCFVTGSFDDLHLVVVGHGDQADALILSSIPRASLPGNVTLSVPVALLDLKSLKQLVEMGKLPEHGTALDILRRWFEADHSLFWEQYRRSREAQQEKLALDVADGGRLF